MLLGASLKGKRRKVQAVGLYDGSLEGSMGAYRGTPQGSPTASLGSHMVPWEERDSNHLT